MILALSGERAGPDDLTPLPRIGATLAGQLRLAGHPPLSLPPIREGRLRRIADALGADPGDARTLQDWARELATSTRTLARAFQREVGMPFREYRRQVRLHAAMERLAQGRSVTTVAHELGFGAATNFSTMFRRATGMAPRAYFTRRPGG
ncbi:helix-turn-helix transcriptional regulator [Fulvimonas yonginensis]|uniref:Helix-turn-helix transcriptional regulator n=2 Tax=Fulvimonas yonginensis TaxID=1495200 RepID=A0ABU8JD75_9GAMM